MKNCLIEDIKYLIYSKKLYVMLAISIITLIIMQYSSYRMAINQYDSYSWSILNQNSYDEIITEQELKDKAEWVQGLIDGIVPTNSTNQILYLMIMIIPMLLTTYTIIIKTMDRESKCYKIKSVVYSKSQRCFARKEIMYLLALSLLVISLIVGKISNYIIYKCGKNNNFSGFNLYSQIDDTIVMYGIRIFIIMLFSIFFIELSEFVVNLCKKPIISIVVIYVYVLFMNLKYQYVYSAYHFLFNKYFDMKGIVTINTEVIKKFNTTSAFIVAVMGPAILFAANYKIETKRSGFEG